MNNTANETILIFAEKTSTRSTAYKSSFPPILESHNRNSQVHSGHRCLAALPRRNTSQGPVSDKWSTKPEVLTDMLPVSSQNGYSPLV